MMGDVILLSAVFVALSICQLLFGPLVTFVVGLALLTFCVGALWGAGRKPPPPDSTTLAQKGADHG